jgi:hypothetical protein
MSRRRRPRPPPAGHFAQHPEAQYPSGRFQRNFLLPCIGGNIDSAGKELQTPLPGNLLHKSLILIGRGPPDLMIHMADRKRGPNQSGLPKPKKDMQHRHRIGSP